MNFSVEGPIKVIIYIFPVKTVIDSRGSAPSFSKYLISAKERQRTESKRVGEYRSYDGGRWGRKPRPPSPVVPVRHMTNCFERGGSLTWSLY